MCVKLTDWKYVDSMLLVISNSSIFTLRDWQTLHVICFMMHYYSNCAFKNKGSNTLCILNQLHCSLYYIFCDLVSYIEPECYFIFNITCLQTHASIINMYTDCCIHQSMYFITPVSCKNPTHIQLFSTQIQCQSFAGYTVFQSPVASTYALVQYMQFHIMSSYPYHLPRSCKLIFPHIICGPNET